MSTTDTGSDASGMIFNASNVNLDMVAANPGLMTQVICYLELGQNEYDGGLGKFHLVNASGVQRMR